MPSIPFAVAVIESACFAASARPRGGPPACTNTGLPYGDIPVVDRVDLTVAQGEIVMIIGPSGAGKSTLLRCVNRIEIPTTGEIIVDGTNMAGEQHNGHIIPDKPAAARKRRHIGMVFQRFNLFAHLSALDNVVIGPRRVLGMKPADARALAAQQLDRVRMADHAAKRIPNSSAKSSK